MANKVVTTGNKGGRTRSDCFITLELTSSGGVSIDLQSKVKPMYGKSIIQLTEDIFSFFDIKHAKIKIEDTGALPFVLGARIEAAIKKLVDTDKQYIFDLLAQNKYPSSRERFRFSRLYLPGNTPSMMLNAGIHKPDGVILDLEDSVAPDKKAEAQLLIRNALCQVDFYGAERMVRINQLPRGLEDLKYIVPYNLHLILIPKCESAEQVQQVDAEIANIRENNPSENMAEKIFYMPIIESALGVEKAYEISTASKNVVALAIGLEDFTADLGVQRTKEATESLFARMRLVNAAKAARIQPIDSVFSDVSDMEGLKENVRVSKSLGFEGMGCIHPRQIKIIKDSFAPEEKEIEKAKKIVNAFIDATEKGLGVVSLGSKMIDPPVVKRAEKVIKLAVDMNIIPENWREEMKEQQ